jgi:hypothetical protein
MKMAGRCCGLALVVCGFLPLTAAAQNFTKDTATSLAIGQPPVSLALARDQMERWYFSGWAVAGRSYCAVTGLAEDYRYETAKTLVTVYRLNGTTVLGLNINAFGTEPGATWGSRVCWIAPATEIFYVKVEWSDPLDPNPPPSPRYLTLRILETTLWCPWFFLDGDYNAFTLLRNTTNAAVDVTVTWRDVNGNAVGTYSGSIPGNGSLALSARTYVTGATSGSVEVAHNRSPQAIQGSTTTLSGTTGVGFDAVFTQRQPW